jgi:hypothetical protein
MGLFEVFQDFEVGPNATVPAPPQVVSNSSSSTPIWQFVLVILVTIIVIGISITFLLRKSKEVSERKNEGQSIEKAGQKTGICPSCGIPNDETIFCRNCGKKLG